MKALPAASFIGFTGTPIEKADANTQETFGGYVSIYDIEDAKEDKATVPIYYESRLAKLDINREEIDRLNKDVEEVIEDEEDVFARESTKGKWAKLVGAKERVEEIVADWSGDLIVPIFVFASAQETTVRSLLLMRTSRWRATT